MRNLCSAPDCNNIRVQILKAKTYLFHGQHALLLDHSIDRRNITVRLIQQEFQTAVLGVLHQVAVCFHVVLFQCLLLVKEKKHEQVSKNYTPGVKRSITFAVEYIEHLMRKKIKNKCECRKYRRQHPTHSAHQLKLIQCAEQQSKKHTPVGASSLPSLRLFLCVHPSSQCAISRHGLSWNILK